MLKNCQIFWEVVVPTKTRKKKSNKHGSGNAYFLGYVLLSIVADIWLWVRLRNRQGQGKHRGNKYCMVTVVAEGQRDALLWTDVTFSISYNKCHERMSSWTSPMNKSRATGSRKYAFPDPSVIVFFFFFSCCDMYYHLSQHWALVLATMNKCTELRKYALPNPYFMIFFFLFLWVLPPLKILDTFFLTPCIFAGIRVT